MRRRRSYSYSPSPPSGGDSRRHGSPKGRCEARGRDLPTSLLVRNLRHDCRAEDLRGPFGEFGPLKDVYLPQDYHTWFVLFLSLRSFLCCGEPRGFGFVQYLDPADAEDAKYHIDGQILFGRDLTVVFAVENRKKSAEMWARDRSRGRVSERRRSISHSPRYGRSYCRSPGYYSPSPRCRHYSRSISRSYQKYRERSYSRSPYGTRYRERSYSRSPYDSRSRSGSPIRVRNQSLEGY